MKTLPLASFMVLLTLISLVLSAQTVNHEKSFYDKYGREIISDQNERIEYEYSPLSIPSFIEAEIEQSFQNYTTSSNCNTLWKQGIMGSCIGENSMVAVDINNDGIVEIICSGGSGFGNGNFWYVLEYNSHNQIYEQVWISDYYSDYNERINTISAYDANNDNIYEIFLGFDDGHIEVYDGESMELIYVFETTMSGPVNRIIANDVDNDGKFEIAACSDVKTSVFDASTYHLKTEFSFGGDDMECGNVDTDNGYELVYSTGNVVQINGEQYTTKWDFTSDGSEGFIELTDTDSDGMKEIVFARYWYNIVVYDADIQSPKYEIESDLDIDALTVYDVNGDGINEILYGDGQWGSIYCHKAQNGLLLWSINNPEHGTTNIAVADADMDGELEVLWGSGCSSTGSDYLFVHEVISQNFEWKSVHIDGPFYAVEVADVNDDGNQEIITLSYESESGYDSGILSIFDAVTHDLIWQSDGNFLYGCWTGMFDIEIEDVDKDGQTEIIVAAGQTYTGKIWVIDGSTYEIESEHYFGQEDIDEFYSFDIGDVDNDGSLEYVAGNDNHVYVINTDNYTVEWQSVSLGYGKPSAIYIENVDSNPNMDIVICKNKIYIIDGITHQQWESYETIFTNVDIYDLNNDGQKDIIASTSAGEIIKIDGETHDYEYLLTDFPTPIDGIKITDLVGDAEPEIVFTSEGSVSFYKINENIMTTQSFGTIAGAYDGLSISDYDNNGEKEVIVGTNYLTIELGEDCYECVDFSIEVVGTDLTCSEGDDGIVEVIPNGGQAPYTYVWNFGGDEAMETGLPVGTYSVEVTDGRGCSQVAEVSIKQAAMYSYYTSTDVGCNGVNDGTAEAHIIDGNAPYTFNWSTGEVTAKISGLAKGNYSLTITDSKQCISEYTIPINQDSVNVYLDFDNISCFGEQDGSINSWIISGYPPYTYEWSTGATTRDIFNLNSGWYSLTVRDSLNCSSIQEVVLSEPDEIVLAGSSSPDNPTTPDTYEGSATVVASGGNPPFFYQWDDPYYQTNSTATNLSEGLYQVVVTDINGCKAIIEVLVESATSIGEFAIQKNIVIYPNPGSDFINIEFDLTEEQDLNISIFNQMGKQINGRTIQKIKKGKITMDISTFKQGVYSVVFTNGNEIATKKLIVIN